VDIRTSNAIVTVIEYDKDTTEYREIEMRERERAEVVLNEEVSAVSEDVEKVDGGDVFEEVEAGLDEEHLQQHRHEARARVRAQYLWREPAPVRQRRQRRRRETKKKSREREKSTFDMFP
jgi:ribosome-interacting GTPase 1